MAKGSWRVEPAYDAAKFRELILYVAEKLADDPTFGLTKLNKALYFSDFLAYGQLGVPITGAKYQALEFGPAPRALLPALKELMDGDSAEVVEDDFFNLPQKRVVPRRRPDLELFSATEIDIVNDVVEALRHATATQVSRLSHVVSLGWKLAELREEIPYETVFLAGPETVTPADIQRGRELAEEYGWVA